MNRKTGTRKGQSPETVDAPLSVGADAPLSVGAGNSRSPVTIKEMAMELLWSTEDLEAAEPYPIEISVEIIKKAKVLKPQVEEVAGAGDSQAGGLPEAAEEEETGIVPTATTGGYDYPGPYTRHEVLCAPYTCYPYCTVGKLFFKQHGNSYVASAASIGNYAIWTAGHCVHAGDGKPDGWSTNLVFVPAYKDGNAPFGQWPASYLMARTAWVNNGIPNGLCEDMGGAILFPQGGKKISQAVGWLGFAWNWSRYQHWDSLGYPAASPFNGQRMVCTEASFAYLESGLGCSLKPQAIGCDMTGGCSGGPWIMQLGTNNYVNGHNSYRSRPEEIYSPYIGNEANSLWSNLLKGTP